MTIRTNAQNMNLPNMTFGFALPITLLPNVFFDIVLSRYKLSGISSSMISPISNAKYCAIFTSSVTPTGTLNGLSGDQSW